MTFVGLPNDEISSHVVANRRSSRTSPIVSDSCSNMKFLSNGEIETGSIISSTFLPNILFPSNQKLLNYNLGVHLDDKKNIIPKLNKDITPSDLSSFDTDK